jgi:hypothetical protein
MKSQTQGTTSSFEVGTELDRLTEAIAKKASEVESHLRSSEECQEAATRDEATFHSSFDEFAQLEREVVILCARIEQARSKAISASRGKSGNEAHQWQYENMAKSCRKELLAMQLERDKLTAELGVTSTSVQQAKCPLSASQVSSLVSQQ